MPEPESAASTLPRRGGWRKRVFRILVGLVALYLVVRGADSARFHLGRPTDFNDANWSGEWRTTQLGLTGRLLVKLPSPLPIDQDFKAQALVYYPVYSPFRTGQFVRMDFAGRYTLDVSPGVSTNNIPAGGKLFLKGSAGAQIVEYTAMIDDEGGVVTGGYRSKSPQDLGTFWIERK